MSKVFEVCFGALSPPMHEQLAQYGLRAKTVEIIQEDANAITRLSVRGILTWSEADRARKRLMKEITRAIRDQST